MQMQRYCRSCTGPRPRAARRCPWCGKTYESNAARPEHLFATFEQERVIRNDGDERTS